MTAEADRATSEQFEAPPPTDLREFPWAGDGPDPLGDA